MTSFGRLWKRAPLWRTSVIVGIGALGLAAWYPTAGVKRALPWLPGHGPTSYADGSSGASGTQHHRGHRNQPVGVPDISITEHGSISIAGRTLPLPAGDWHPILTAQVGHNREISRMLLARVDRGVVSGVIVVEATQVDLPTVDIGGIDNPCHDDRNFATHLTQNGTSAECGYTSTAVMVNHSISPDPFVTAAFKRMANLGFPISDLLVKFGWYHIQRSGQNDVQVESVETYIAPIEQGSRQLLAPMQNWDKATYRNNPDASAFIEKMDHWALDWARALRAGFDGTLDKRTLVPPLINDPSAPRPS